MCAKNWPSRPISSPMFWGSLKRNRAATNWSVYPPANRTEVYAEAKDRTKARDGVKRVLQSYAGKKKLASHLYFHESEGAVRHLFSVASGLDSMVQGEHEIMAQVKHAYQAAHQSGLPRNS